jgi:hypothetical protein
MYTVHTCEAKENFTQRDPSFLFVPSEIVDDIFCVESLQGANVILDHVIDPNSCHKEQPHENHRCKCVTNFVGPKALDREENHQNPHCDPYRLICSQVSILERS